MYHVFELLLVAFLGLVAIIFWIWMLVDCARNPGLRDDTKIGWLLVVILLNWLGALVYFFAGRTHKMLQQELRPRSQQ